MSVRTLLFYNIKDRQYLRKEISLDLYRDGWINKIQEDSIYYEVYVEEYQDYESVESRIF